MENNKISSEMWKIISEEAWREAAREGTDVSCMRIMEKMSGMIAEKLGSQETKAFVESIGVLVDYTEKDMGEDETALDAESEAVAVAKKTVRPIVEVKLQRRLDDLDRKQSGKMRCMHCGGKTLSQGRRKRPWRSLLGKLNLSRRYRCCGDCDKGQWPAQKDLGLPEEEFTARFEEVCSLMATTVPHEMAVKLLALLSGVEISEKAVQDMVSRRAEKLEQRLEKQRQDYNPYEENGLPVETPRLPEDATESPPQLAYLEMDGVIPMTREEKPVSKLSQRDLEIQKEAKAQKVRGGKGRRYELVGREVKNAVLYRGEDCAQEMPSRGCLLDKRYVSYLGDWKHFASLLWVEMLRQGFDKAKRLIILSDGADWIRSIAEWLPIEPLMILDLYHAKRRVWEMARIHYGPKNSRGKKWAKKQCERIEQGKVTRVIESLRFLRPRTEDAKDCIASLTTYFKNNLDRMDYPTYRLMGLRVGSGAVESANYHLTGARLKLQGMRWSEQGARDMAFLRADLFNGQWENSTRAFLAA